jgi:hypothetical protein
VSFRPVLAVIITVACVFCIFVPLSRKRQRARWAKLLFVAVGVLGLGYIAASVGSERGWFVLTHSAVEPFLRLLQFTRGLLIGLLLALLFSGEVLGKKVHGKHDEPI